MVGPSGFGSAGMSFAAGLTMLRVRSCPNMAIGGSAARATVAPKPAAISAYFMGRVSGLLVRGDAQVVVVNLAAALGAGVRHIPEHGRRPVLVGPGELVL